MTPCRFFARGVCRNGDSCEFSHDRNPSTHSRPERESSVLPAINHLTLGPAGATNLQWRAKSSQTCKFFAQGLCNRGDQCDYLHTTSIRQPYYVQPEAHSHISIPGQDDESITQTLSDSRASVRCKFQPRPGGCQKQHCPFFHATQASVMQGSDNRGSEGDEDEASGPFFV